MDVEARTERPLATDADAIAVGVFEGEDVAHDTPDRALGRLLESGEARRKRGHLAVTHAEGRRFILAGLGPRDTFGPEPAREVAAVVLRRARELAAQTLCWEAPHHLDDATIGGLVEGTQLRARRFDRYRPDRADRPAMPRRLLISAHHDVSGAVSRADVMARAQNRARDLGDTPANDLTPRALADYARAAGERHGVEVTVLGEEEIAAAGMGAFAAVARGSHEPAQLIALRYRGADGPPLGLVGKAITFDSGGISLKPRAKMFAMKFDMLGGAAVIESICALAELGAPVHVIGVVGASENMPGGRAMRPGDIVTALDGTTIEINNTDAEGRLVLADCLAYAIARGATRLVDVATLTGGVAIALGSVYTGLLSNDDAWAAEVLAAAEATGEIAWRLPLHPRYAETIRGRYGEIVNLTDRLEATAITAGEFLHRFAGDVPWAHLDIAGTAWDVKRPYFTDRGATGIGTRLLVELAQRVAGA